MTVPAIGTSWPTAPRASRARSRTGPSCVPTRTRWSEGLAIAALAVGASAAYIAVKASFRREIEALERGARGDGRRRHRRRRADHARRRTRGVPVRRGEGLLEVIEGDDPLPRLFPPYMHGLFATHPGERLVGGARAGSPPTTFDAANPTLVNNVETLATVPHILAARRRVVPRPRHQPVRRRRGLHRRRRRRRDPASRGRARHAAAAR